jgi:chromosome segregation ATPase
MPKNFTNVAATGTSRAQAMEAALEFAPPGAREHFNNLSETAAGASAALQEANDAHDATKAALDEANNQIAQLAQELAAEKEAHERTSAALAAATAAK